MSHTHWTGSPNYSPVRMGVEAVVIHLIDDEMDNDIKGTDYWFRSPGSGVSAHYAVSSGGDVHQYVTEQMSAFHAGRVYKPTWALLKKIEGRIASPNIYTIGVEHEGRPDDEWPEAMLEASAKLVAQICSRHRIPKDRDHIIGHRELNSLKTCPGNWIDLKKYVDRVRAYAGAEVV